MEEFNFNISEELKKDISISISEAIGVDLKHAKKQIATSTQNYASTLPWDLINTNLIKKANCETITFSTKKRGIWEFLLMLDKESNRLITFMREDRLKKILKSSKNNAPHYLNALALLNEELKPKTKQTSLFDMSEYTTAKYDKEQLAEMLNNLCNDLKQGNPLSCNHIVVTFSSLKGQLCSLNAFALNSSLQLVDTESWSKFIAPTYDSIGEDEHEIAEEKDIPMRLTKEALKKKEEKEGQKEDFPSLKKSEEEKNNNIEQNGEN